MNGVRVPAQYKHEVRRERSSREWIEATIRDYVKARPNVIITQADFIEAMDGLTTAGHHVARLVKERKLTRRQVHNGKTGRSFAYTWHDTPVPIPEYRFKPTHGEPVTKPRSAYATPYELKRINQFFMDYVDTELTAEEIAHANKFRKFVWGKVDEKDQPKVQEEKEDGTETEDDKQD